MFLITLSISILVVGLSDFLFLRDSILEGRMSLGIYFRGCPICWCTVFTVFYYNPLYFCGTWCYFSSFILDFIYKILFSFFLVSLAKDLSITKKKKKRFVNFIYLLSEPALSFINPFYCLFSLYFIYFHSDLYYLLPTVFGIHLFFFLVPFF